MASISKRFLLILMTVPSAVTTGDNSILKMVAPTTESFSNIDWIC